MYSITISRLLAWKLLGLLIGCAAKFVTGSLFVFAVYQDAVKDTFNYTQKEGKKAELYDHLNPNWAPSVNLGGQKRAPSTSRYDRQQEKKRRKPAESTTIVGPDHTETGMDMGDSVDEDGVQSQTDVDGPLMEAMSLELQELRTENGELKEKVAHLETKFTAMELLSSMLNMGLGVGFLPGMFYDHFGPQWTSAVGLVVSVVAYMLIWSATKSVRFYSDNSWLMAIYFFVCGLGSVFTYMVALNTNVINFDKKHTGKVIGLLNAFFAGSPAVFAALYYHVYSHGDTSDTANQNYPAFMLTFAISFAVVDILCIIFLRVYDDESPGPYSKFENDALPDVKLSRTTIQRSRYDSPYDSTDVQRVESLAVSSRSGSPPGDDPTEQSLPLLKLLVNYDYHILVWTLALASSVGLVFVNNITVISKSLHLSRYDDRLTMIIPITNAIVSFSVGILSDVFKKWLPRIWLLIGACCCFVISQLLALFFSEIVWLMAATTFAGIGIGVLWSMAPTILRELFYVGNLGRNWGIAIFLSSLLGFSIQEAFGFMYDHQVTDKTDNFCYGTKCVKGGIALCTAVACLSVVCGLAFQFKRSCHRRCTRPV